MYIPQHEPVLKLGDKRQPVRCYNFKQIEVPVDKKADRIKELLSENKKLKETIADQNAAQDRSSQNIEYLKREVAKLTGEKEEYVKTATNLKCQNSSQPEGEAPPQDAESLLRNRITKPTLFEKYWAPKLAGTGVCAGKTLSNPEESSSPTETKTESRSVLSTASRSTKKSPEKSEGNSTVMIIVVIGVVVLSAVLYHQMA